MAEPDPVTPRPRLAAPAWALFDWANSPYPTVVVTFVFAVYFQDAVVGDVARATELWGLTLAVSALGAPALAVLIFEVLLNGASMFNHANVRLPRGLDRWLRWIIVTPDMHRVHHSIRPHETNSNFGFNLPWWDRLFGTYRAAPAAGHAGMTIGLAQFRDAGRLSLGHILLLPFRGSPGAYPLGRRDDG